MATISVHDLRPGDVLLHAGSGEISKLIMWASDSDYSHIAMVFEPGLGAEAVAGGVGYAINLPARVSDPRVLFIDAMRPQLAPLTPPLLLALQNSARAMKDAEFALNQMFELGVISALRNKVPASRTLKLLLEWVFSVLVKADPERLVCSEFIYLAFMNAQTIPPGVLRPKIVELDRPDRRFPAIDWLKLLQEYQHASGLEPAPLPPALVAVLKVASVFTAERVAGHDEPDAVDHELDGRYAGALQAVRSRLLQTRSAQVWSAMASAGVEAVGTHPELLLPQHFADSPSFTAMGRVVP